MELILLVAVIVLFILHSSLKNKVADIEAQLSGKQTAPQTPLYTLPETMPQASVPPTIPPLYAEPKPNAFFDWLARDWILKLGGLFLLIGMGWFVSYAIANNWIGPVGRVVLGLITGASILALGAWRIRTYENQGAIFTVLGSTIILITAYFASSPAYNILDPFSSLLLMFLSVLFVAVVSVVYARNSLALASVMLAFIAPYLTNAQPYTGTALHFSYILVVVLGALFVVYKTGWRNLTFAALVGTGLSTMLYINGFEQFTSLLWIFVFVSIFIVANILSQLRERSGEAHPVHIFTAVGSVLLLVMWIYHVAPAAWQSMLYSAWAVVCASGAYLVFQRTQHQGPFYVYGAASIGLIGAATAAEFSGSVLVLAFTLEVAALVGAAILLNMRTELVHRLSVLFLVPIILSLESFVSPLWQFGVLHEDFFVLLVLALTLLCTGLVIHIRAPREASPSATPGIVFISVGVLYLLSLFWLVVHTLITEGSVATMIALITYTILGLWGLIYGRVTGSDGLRIGGGALLAFVAGRLLFVDVWQMDLLGRVVTFIAVGTLLLSTAFIKRAQQ
jgi:uncharacterized membrane protein